MKHGMCSLLLLTVSVAVIWSTTTVSAQSDCTNVLISMALCLGYITGNSTTPSQQCCNQLANAVRSSPECLCEVPKGGGPQLGINVSQTQALALPKACNVETPPASSCNVNSHAGLSNISGSRVGSSSDGNSIKLSFPLLAILSTASYIICSKY
ncbi:Bifunctional inhibitor/lipid-transfer protein/seed storage 2S albumin superfamily protein [Raphanus sativus]|nr:Bifunctional inhibitor/lipid-transfer protein/seed storage 2S albumin superfamily protein [Raphanus sativus]